MMLERVFFHDILNTAGAVCGLLEVSKEDRYTEESDCISTAYRTTRQLIEEIESQRFLAAAERGEVRFTRTGQHTLPLLRQIVDSYSMQTCARGKELVIADRCANVYSETDWTILRRVVGNMTKNALEATQQNGRVTLGCRHDATMVRITVHNPSFIPRDVQLQIFQRSFSTKGGDRGLGTYSMRFFSERYLGGHVSFKTSEQEGTTFSVVIPKVPTPDVQCIIQSLVAPVQEITHTYN